jgi:hypothetical protein
VDVNASGIGMAVLLFLSIEPQYPCDNRIAAWGIGRKDFAGWDSVIENRALSVAFADFCSDKELSQRGGIASIPVARAEFGGGDRISHHGDAIPDEGHLLLFDTNDKSHSAAMDGRLASPYMAGEETK